MNHIPVFLHLLKDRCPSLPYLNLPKLKNPTTGFFARRKFIYLHYSIMRMKLFKKSIQSLRDSQIDNEKENCNESHRSNNRNGVGCQFPAFRPADLLHLSGYIFQEFKHGVPPHSARKPDVYIYFVSRCKVCIPHVLQYFLASSLAGWVAAFLFVV